MEDIGYLIVKQKIEEKIQLLEELKERLYKKEQNYEDLRKVIVIIDNFIEKLGNDLDNLKN